VTAFFWGVTQRVAVIPHRRFGQHTLRNIPEERASHIYLSHLTTKRNTVLACPNKYSHTISTLAYGNIPPTPLNQPPHHPHHIPNIPHTLDKRTLHTITQHLQQRYSLLIQVFHLYSYLPHAVDICIVSSS
jgi:hypothetical protein